VLRVNHQNVGCYSLSSASVGLTLGIAKHSEIIMFMTQLIVQRTDVLPRSGKEAGAGGEPNHLALTWSS
jgi:hypothetical protein